MNSRIGFEDLAWMFPANAGQKAASELTIEEAACLWRLGKNSKGPILELRRGNGSSTMLLAAGSEGRNAIVSCGVKTPVHADVAQFLSDRGLRESVDFREETPYPMEHEFPYGLVTLHAPSKLDELFAHVLSHWVFLKPTASELPLIALILPKGANDKGVDFTGWKALFADLMMNQSAEHVASAGRIRVIRRRSDPWASRYFRAANFIRDEGFAEAALPIYKRGLDVHPTYSDLWNEYGRCLVNLDRDEEAKQAFETAISHKKVHHYYNNLGLVHLRLGNPLEAEIPVKKAIALQPSYAHGYNNLGWAYEEESRVPEAIRMFRKAIEILPDFIHANFNLGRVLLMNGDIKEGLERYEYRWKVDKFPSPKRDFPCPLWDGSNLKGKRIVIWGEQGVGDQLTFASMIPDVIRMGATGAIECAEKLMPLFKASFKGFEIFPLKKHATPELLKLKFDYHCPMVTLSRYLRPTIESFPKTCGYLKLPADKIKYWKGRLDQFGDTVKVGLGWTSKLLKGCRAKHYATIEQLEPVLRTPGCTFITLHYDECVEDIEKAKKLFGVTIHRLEDLDLYDDLESTLAMCSSLDIGVTTKYSSPVNYLTLVDVPTLAFGCGLTERNLGTDAFPWYPSARDFRWEFEGDRTPVFQAIAKELGDFVNSKKSKGKKK